MPPEEIPSLRKYLREHAPAQIASRVFAGVPGAVSDAAESYGYFKYALVLALAVIGAALLNARKAKAIGRAHRVEILFLAAFFLTYALLFLWYRPVSAGGSSRLALMLYLPFLFASARAIRDLAPGTPLRIRGHSLPAREALFLMLTALVLSDVLAVLLDRSLHMYGAY